MKKPPGIMIYVSVYSSFRSVLSLEQKGILLDALADYHQTGEIPNYVEDPVLQAAVNVFLSDIKRDEKKYSDMCERNAYIARNRRRPSELPLVTSRDDSSPINTNINTNTNSNSNTKDIKTTTKRTLSKRFTPPTIEEVRIYCEERKNRINPEHFIDYYERSDWIMSNGQKMKDWKACIRTWERNEQKGGNNGFSRTRSTDRVPGQRDLYEF